MKSLIKITLICFLLFGFNTNVFAQTPEDLFLKAMMKEEGDGSLNEAIEIYANLVEHPNAERALKAKALLQLGECYEKLGQNKAAAAYKKLISEYGDQKELIAVAKKKLRYLETAALPKSNGLLSEKIQKNIMGGIILNRVSPDGRYCSFLDTRPNSEYAEEIVAYDFKTQKIIPITEGHVEVFGEESSRPWNSVWSPKGDKVAYSYSNHETPQQRKFEVILKDVGAENWEVLFSEVNNYWGAVHDFSPDGQNVLFSMKSPDGAETVFLKLMEINIYTKKAKVLKEFTNTPIDFRYSPVGDHISYTSNNDIHIFNIETSNSERITSFDGMDWNAHWSVEGDKLVFLSDRHGSNDLFFVEIEDGKTKGVPKSLKRHLGDGATILGIDVKGEVFVSANNSRTDLYTLDFSDSMEMDESSIHQITPPGSMNSNGLARFSKDGKYISYQSNLTKLTDGLRSDIQSKYADYDEELGWRYKINIYNTDEKSTKQLNLPLYLNHNPRSQAWMVPSWSYHNNELLVHARVRDNFEGGFFIVNAEDETFKPVLTKPNCKLGMKRNEVEMGNSMIFSRKKNIIYFSDNSWKKAMQYNIDTKELKPIAEIDEGFWFEGFIDKAETKLNAVTRLGYFEYDVSTKEKVKYAERNRENPFSIFLDRTEGFKMYNMTNQKIKIDMDNGNSKIHDLNKLFPETIIRIQDYQPLKNQLLLKVTKNPGREIYKLSNVFEL